VCSSLFIWQFPLLIFTDSSGNVKLIKIKIKTPIFMRPMFSPIPFSTNPFLFIFLILIANFNVNMDLNIEGLTIEDDGLTINLDVDVLVAPILENCLIGRVLSDK